MELQDIGADFDIQTEIEKTTGHVYLLMDGARFDAIHKFIYEHEEFPDYFPLYRNTVFASCHAVSPCVVKLPGRECSLFEWYVTQGADENKAVVLVADKTTEELGMHFQEFLEATLPDGRSVLLRFYDPAVLTVLATLTHNGVITRLFQPFRAIYWKNDTRYHKLAT